MGGTTSIEERSIKKARQSPAPQVGATRLTNLLWFSAIALMLAGWVMLVDTGLIFEGRADTGQYASLLLKRGVCMVLGFVALWFMWRISPKRLRQAAPWIAVLALLLLGLVFSPLGATVRGCRGWLNLGILTFQPLEFAKLGLVWFLAHILARTGPLKRAPLSEYIGPAIVAALAVLLVMAENEFSGMIFLVAIIAIMALLSGINRTQFMWMSGAGVTACLAVIAIWPEKLHRFQPFIRPLTDLDGSGYQVGQSLWAIVNGGTFGMGPGRSIAMYSLPDHTTDFIFSIICEQYGIIGGLAILALFFVFAWAAFSLAIQQKDTFRLYLGCGIAAIFSLQAAINTGVAANVFPVTGLPLPFVSAGGSSLMMSLMELGLLLNLSRTVGNPVEYMMPAARGHSPTRPGTTLRRTTTIREFNSPGRIQSSRSKSDWLHPAKIDMLYSQQRRRVAR
jgi:cell division protein FtsW